MAVTGVPHRKVRAGLLRNQNRQFVRNVIVTRHAVCCRVRADCKFSHRQRLMVHQHIVADIVFVLRLILEIGAGVFFHHAVLEIDLQILIIQTIQIYLSDMQFSVRPLKHRRRKHLTHRNIHVRHTVLKCSLSFGILKLPDVDI